MKGLAADLRHAARLYRGTLGSSIAAVVVLAFAMACIGAFLSLYTDIALKPHPGFEQSDALATISQSDGNRFNALSYELIERIGEEVASVEAVAGVNGRPLKLAPGDEDTMPVELVTRDFFSGLRPRLALGRGFDERDHEPGAEPVTVISHRFWQAELGGRPDAIGRTVRISGTPIMSSPGAEEESRERTTEYRIVGVMAPSRSMFGQATLWLPFEQAAPLYIYPDEIARRMTLLYGVARLQPGGRPDALAAQLNGRYAEAGEEVGLRPGFRLAAMRGVSGNIDAQREAARQVRLFLGRCAACIEPRPGEAGSADGARAAAARGVG